MERRADFLRFDAIGKKFPGIRALDAVSFTVAAGSVHALLGENGAGKSTILKILSGAQAPDEGTISIACRPVSFANTTQAIDAGVSVIYQELHLVPEMSVAKNIFLSHLPRVAGFLNSGELNRRARTLLETLGERGIEPRASVASLPIGQRQMVEIAKALSREARIIAFDEPTSSLSSREVDQLFSVIRGLRDRGRAIVYVSHRMDEIESLCGAATVLRDGKHVRTFVPLAGTTRDTLVQSMVGRPIDDVFNYSPRPHGEMLLEVERVTGKGVAEPASMNVRAGEIVGVFGLIGAGRSELLRLMYGAEPRFGGRVRVGGVDIVRGGTAEGIRHGIVLCPEDRKKDGIIPQQSVAQNINLASRRRLSWMKLVTNPRRERENALQGQKSLGIRAASLDMPIAKLSGGNQQKAILARWLGEDVRVVLLDEPTRGIDVGAKAEIYSIIYRIAGRGAAVVLVSSELPEVLGVCDRIIVMRQGAIAGELSRDEATQERVLAMALPKQGVASTVS